MTVTVSIVDGPLPPAATRPASGAGAVALFEGVARPLEAEAPIEALEYEVYQPMAERRLLRLGEELMDRFTLLEMRVEHSRGVVGAGERSFRLIVCAPHRKEALAAMDEFIDRMKRDVPIWKRPVAARDGQRRAATPSTSRARAAR